MYSTRYGKSTKKSTVLCYELYQYVIPMPLKTCLLYDFQNIKNCKQNPILIIRAEKCTNRTFSTPSFIVLLSSFYCMCIAHLNSCFLFYSNNSTFTPCCFSHLYLLSLLMEIHHLLFYQSLHQHALP